MIKRLISVWDNTSFHPRPAVYILLLVAAGLFALSYFFGLLLATGIFFIAGTTIGVLIDSLLLYRKVAIRAERQIDHRLSNGDANTIVIHLFSTYVFKTSCRIIEELPFQLPEPTLEREVVLQPRERLQISYTVRPVERGEYNFGQVNVYATGPLKLVERRYRLAKPVTVKVYPSYLQLKRYQLLAMANHTGQMGVKRIRRLGQSLEFEQIKEYVRGDDYRTLNWKATARKGQLMVNSFTDERSQQIYCIINKGRVMKMPFAGMTLLDYSINASLVLCGVAVQKHDKAGLISFSKGIDNFLPADNKQGQVGQIMESLYGERTDFSEPDFEKLFSLVRNRISHRSLLVLFTNFESIESLQRELPSLKKLAKYHLLLVIFFENTELNELVQSKAGTTEDIYIKTIAEKYRLEKQLIARELQMHGIATLLSAPQQLSINAINRYLELKNRQSI